MAQWWIYASAGFVGMLWGGGYVQPAVALAFITGLLFGVNGNVDKWVIVAFIAGYVVGSIVVKKRQGGGA